MQWGDRGYHGQVIHPSLRAVLWDMDGTIVDTEPFWMEAEIELIGAHGGTWTHEDGLQVVGLGLEDSARLFQAAGVDLPVTEIVEHLTDRVMAKLAGPEVVFRPGAREMLAAAKAAGMRNALVTMSRRRMAEQVAALLPPGTFDVVLGGDNVPRPKPFPDPYLAGAAALGVDVREAVAIEDSPNGVRSAVAAGVATIGVPHIVPLEGTGATELWPTLADRTPDDLRAAHERFTR